MRTHYDNLNVSENAPEEVIRAAYKVLALRFHPDSNIGSAESKRVMQILNAAYEVLSDTNKRREYDRLLVAVRSQAASRPRTTTKTAGLPKWQPQSKTAPMATFRSVLAGILALIFSDVRITLVVIGLCIWGFSSLIAKKTPSRTYSPSSTTPSHTPSSYTPPPARPKWVRPSLSPAGTPWPATAGYISGHEIQAQGGLSTVTIDNTRNSSDVFLKLVWLSSAEAVPVRMCYIPAYSSFTFPSVMVGRYDVRYQDLTTGGISKTEEFLLEERATNSGTTYSNLTMTLYKVANGNMTTEAIDESEF